MLKFVAVAVTGAHCYGRVLNDSWGSQMSKRAIALVLVIVVCASCITGVKAGKRCNTSDWGDDGVYAMKCEKGRWVRKATKAQVAQLLIAVAKARQATTTTTTLPPAPELPITVASDGVISRRLAGPLNHETVTSVDSAGNWFGIVFRYVSGSATRYVGVLAHVTDGPNAVIDAAQQITDQSPPFRLVPSAGGTRAALLSPSGAVQWWSSVPPTTPQFNPVADSIACVTADHLVFTLPGGVQGGIDNSVIFNVGGHPSTVPVDCSPNGRFVSLIETSDGDSFERGEIYDIVNGTYLPVISGVDADDEVAMSGVTDDGGFVAVATASGSGGVWSRATGAVTPLLGQHVGDLPVWINPTGSRVVGVRRLSAAAAQLVQFGPRGSTLFSTPFPAGTDLAFTTDLQAAMRRDTDGSLRLIQPDWTSAG